MIAQMNRINIKEIYEHPVTRFSVRFLGYLTLLWMMYQSYLFWTHAHGELDWVTYKVSELSHALATKLGVANCEFSCFIDGCYVGREGKMVNVLEGCNGLKLAIVYAAYLHTRLIRGWQGRKPALVAAAGLVVIAVCYIGVNLLGIGLHSYGWFLEN